jgi:hypothetical protein
LKLKFEITGELIMIRTEISLFLKNIPGELGKLTELFGQASINIDAITIQDASAYVQNLFEARGKSLKRLASSASYASMKKDSADFALIRLMVEKDKVVEAMELLNADNYLFDTKEVITIELTNTPGELAKITKKFGEEQININYIYGSVSKADGKCLFVFSPEDVVAAAAIFKD